MPSGACGLACYQERVRRGLLLILIVVAGAAASAACGALYDLSALGGDNDAGGADGADGGADGADAARVDAADAADGALDEDSSAPCVYEAGAPMKRIGAFCIDTIEVTNGAYGAFLDRADAGAIGAAPAACSAEIDRVPAENWPSRPEWVDLPVTGVNWCDATAFCAYAGKRLCTSTKEWYRACSKAGTKRLPYGNEPVVGECATVNELRAASGKCEGGYVGIFDMVGNAEEWTSDCTSGDPGATCTVQGGSALDSLADCTTSRPYPRSIKRPLVGFRCCAD